MPRKLQTQWKVKDKRKNIEAVHVHGSMMLILGQAQILGLRNISQIHLLRQVDKKGRRKNIKKSMTSVLDYLRWEDERVFQSVWECDNESVLAYFSNVIKDIETYVEN